MSYGGAPIATGPEGGPSIGLWMVGFRCVRTRP